MLNDVSFENEKQESALFIDSLPLVYFSKPVFLVKRKKYLTTIASWCCNYLNYNQE